ncbi:MAG TPA: hypothetical protein VF796_16875, partial [Humisphaera sp.]
MNHHKSGHQGPPDLPPHGRDGQPDKGPDHPTEPKAVDAGVPVEPAKGLDPAGAIEPKAAAAD